MELPYRQYFDALPCYLTVQDRDFRIVEANTLSVLRDLENEAPPG